MDTAVHRFKLAWEVEQPRGFAVAEKLQRTGISNLKSRPKTYESRFCGIASTWRLQIAEAEENAFGGQGHDSRERMSGGGFCIPAAHVHEPLGEPWPWSQSVQMRSPGGGIGRQL